jgi:hypothetical protein
VVQIKRGHARLFREAPPCWPDKLAAAAVADMQHCHPNATSGVSILHSVAEPGHRVGEAEAMAPTRVRFHYGHRH